MGRVDPAVRREVLGRDRRCVASLVFPHVCRDTFGSMHPADDIRKLELDHVRDEPMMAKEPESRPEHLVALCHWSHQTSGWATSNRPVLRKYLQAHEDGQRPTRSGMRALRHANW
jgi:hypothetical protein